MTILRHLLHMVPLAWLCCAGLAALLLLSAPLQMVVTPR